MVTGRGKAKGKACRRSRRFPRLRLALALGLAFGAPLSLVGQDVPPTEYEVKAAFLYNFARFVEWPDSARAARAGSFSLCLLGEDPFGSVLEETLESKTVHGQPLVIKRLARVNDAVHCHILFISVSEESQLPEILTALAGRSVLTVSEIRRFGQRGGMIRFTVEENRVHFEINPAAAERANLTLSSQLLKLARIVPAAPFPGD